MTDLGRARPPAPARLFVGLWPPVEVVRSLAADRDRWTWPAAARPTPDEDLHLTLHFIGDRPAADLGELEAALARVEARPVEVEIDSAQVWSGSFAVATGRPSPSLLELRAAVGAVLVEHSIELDTRPFAPHITLARRATDCVCPPQPPRAAWTATEFVLAHSVPGASPKYRILRRYPLGPQ